MRVAVLILLFISKALSAAPLADAQMEKDVQRLQLVEAINSMQWAMADSLFDSLEKQGEKYHGEVAYLRAKAAYKNGRYELANKTLRSVTENIANLDPAAVPELRENIANALADQQQLARYSNWIKALDTSDKVRVEGLILESRRNPKALDANGRTLLFYALDYGSARDIKELVIDKDLNPNATDINGNTPLNFAIQYQRINAEPLDAFLALPQVDIHKSSGGWNPLLTACRYTANVPLISRLLAAGADPNSTTSAGWSCLHLIARYYENTEVVDLLVKEGAKLEALNTEARTPLHMTTFSNNQVVAKHLLKLGANRKAKDSNGNTPKEIADENGLRELEKLLK